MSTATTTTAATTAATTTTTTTTTATTATDTTTTSVITINTRFSLNAWYYYDNCDYIKAKISAHCGVSRRDVHGIMDYIVDHDTFPAHEEGHDFTLTTDEFETGLMAAALAASLRIKMAAEALAAKKHFEDIMHEIENEKFNQHFRRHELKKRNAKRAAECDNDDMMAARAAKRAAAAE